MSNYSVSTSESGSFASNAALYTAPSRHRPSARDDSTPKKAAQSTKSTAAMSAAQESPSMTIRRVPADYSERLEDQKARSSALERYKMLVKANRLVPSDGEASPLSVSKRKKDKGEMQREEDEKEDMSTTWRLSDQLPSYVNREQSAASQTVLSDVSDDAGDDHKDEEEAGNGAAGGDGGFSEGRPSAEPRPPHSLSRGHGHPPQHGQWNYGRHSAGDGHRDDSSAATSVSVSVSVERPAYPKSATNQQQRTVEVKPSTAAAAATVVPQLNLSTTPERPVQPVTEAASASRKPHKAAAAALDEMPVDYVAPELTQPYVPSSLKPRSSLRPGYEPVMEHRSGAFTRTSSISTEGLQHGGAGAGPSTPRRKSTAKAGLNGPAKPAAAAATTTAPAAAHVDVVTAPAMEEREEDAEQQQQQDSVANPGQSEQSEDGVVPLPGSKTAFWLRPSSATYDMTASIAAKRKDHVEGEGSVARTRTSSRRNNSHAHGATTTTTSRTGSPCGTPRGRASEQKPRFSTHMSAADRRQYEENASAAAAVPSTAASTYDAIFSTRQSTVQRGSTRRSVQAAAAAPAAAAAAGGGASTYTASSSALSSRGTPRGNSQRRAGPPTELVRTPSSLSRHSSHTAQSVATESAKVVSRQQEAQARHCARVAAGEAARAEAEAALALRPVATPAADSKAKRQKKKDAAAEVPPPPPQPQQRSAAPPPAQAVSKKLSYEAIECDDEEGAGPVPHTVVPQSSKRHAAAAAAAAAEFHTPVRSARSNDEGAGDGSPQTTIHGRRGGDDGATPSKSRRREHDTTASPPRDDSAAVEASFAAREAEMAREKEAVKARQAREALESCRQARLARAEAARTSHSAAATASTNEIVAAMLQGVVQQTRQVLPCFLCAELQSTSGYRVHISACRPAAEATLRDYYTNVAGLADTPAEIVEHVERVAALEVPLSTSDVSIREAYTKECYRCVKSMLVPCRKCHTQLRVQDLKEHEMLCGRAYYQNSRAAERVRSTVDRVERGAEGQ